MCLVPPPCRGTRRHGGLTLIELIVAIAVAAILFTWAIPSFQRFTARNEVAAEVMRITRALTLARNTAVMKRTTISVCSSPGPDHGICTFDDWSHPWLIVAGDAEHGDLSGEQILKLLDGPTRSVRFNRDDRPIRFSSLGRTNGYNGTFSICHTSGESAAVIISNMGRVRTEDKAATC